MESNRKITFADLKSGDILLCPPVPFSLSNPLTCLGHIIIKITGGVVSHAALYCGIVDNKLTVAHADLPGISTVELSDFLLSEHSCYVYRHKLQTNPEIVSNIAIKYTMENISYPVLNLGVLGVLLLTNKFSEKTVKNKVFYDFVVWLSLKIMKEVEKVKYKGKTPMTCSQFVTQCYTDAGEEYDVKFDRMLIQFGETKQNSIGGSVTLLSYLLKNEKVLDTEVISLDENEILNKETQIITNFSNLLDTDSVDFILKGNKDNSIKDICMMGKMLSDVLNMHYPDLLPNALENDLYNKQKSTNRNYFVAPDDLYFNTNNLELIGELKSEHV